MRSISCPLATAQYMGWRGDALLGWRGDALFAILIFSQKVGMANKASPCHPEYVESATRKFYE
jgi:hypothetical protein